MKKCLLCLIISGLVFLGPPACAKADVVELENGSKIVGQVLKIGNGQLVVKTDFAGSITIDLARIVLFRTEAPMHLHFPGGYRVSGKITYTKEQTRIDQTGGDSFISAAPPEHAWPEGARDPMGRHWSYEAGFDVAGKTGNAERVSAGGRVSAKLQGPDDRLLLYMRYAYAKDDSVESDNSIVGGIDFESYFREKHSWYARVELEYDRIRKIDLRTTAATGYGYFFLKKPHHSLRGRAGLMIRREERRDQPAASTLGLDLGISHGYRFDNAWTISTDVTYTPSVEDYRNYRIWHESLFEIPLVASEMWKLQLGVTNDYISRPADHKDYLDTTYFGRLVFSWQ